MVIPAHRVTVRKMGVNSVKIIRIVQKNGVALLIMNVNHQKTYLAQIVLIVGSTLLGVTVRSTMIRVWKKGYVVQMYAVTTMIAIMGFIVQWGKNEYAL